MTQVGGNHGNVSIAWEKEEMFWLLIWPTVCQYIWTSNIKIIQVIVKVWTLNYRKNPTIAQASHHVMLLCSPFQNVHLSGLRCVYSIRYRQANHSTIMLSTPSLLLIIDQVITTCAAPHTDIRCRGEGGCEARIERRRVRERRGRLRNREGTKLGICQHADEQIYCWVLDCQASDLPVAIKCQDIWIPVLVCCWVT